MKRVFIIGLSFLTLAGCGKSSDSPNASPTPPAQPSRQEPSDKYRAQDPQWTSLNQTEFESLSESKDILGDRFSFDKAILLSDFASGPCKTQTDEDRFTDSVKAGLEITQETFLKNSKGESHLIPKTTRVEKIEAADLALLKEIWPEEIRTIEGLPNPANPQTLKKEVTGNPAVPTVSLSPDCVVRKNVATVKKVPELISGNFKLKDGKEVTVVMQLQILEGPLSCDGRRTAELGKEMTIKVYTDDVEYFDREQSCSDLGVEILTYRKVMKGSELLSEQRHELTAIKEPANKTE